MAGKLIVQVDIPGSVRTDELLRKKLAICMALRDRNLAQQVRHSLTRGVDQEMAELGKEAFDLLCREMSEEPAASRDSDAVSGTVGKRQQPSAGSETFAFAEPRQAASANGGNRQRRSA